ncbi:MAG TPA: cadherin-like beta sandwich domain-containing protein, partial [Mucilaginibacter sp.]
SLANNTKSTPVSLKVGNNTITVLVTAQDKTTQLMYTVLLNRAPSSNAGLASLTLGSGGLTPVFATGNSSYTANVGNTITSVTVKPIVSDPTATINVNGAVVSSGAASVPISLKVGNNTITTTVTAQNQTTKLAYKVTVFRAPSSNATLTNLILSNGSLTPAFASATTSYTASVGNTTTSVTIRPIVSDPTATVTVNGVLVAAGSNSRPQPLSAGNNVITSLVTAQDGVTKQAYILTINIAAPTGGVAGFSISSKNLTQAFAPIDTNVQDNNLNNIIVHQAVSPNGDGINDFLFIEGIENFPGNQVTIFDRNGITIYNIKGYDNSGKMFDGHSNINGRMQQPGTYFYRIDYMINGKPGRKTGYFILKFS